MQTPARTDPPYVPIRHTAWPTRKMPRWLLAAGLLVLAAGVLVGIAIGIATYGSQNCSPANNVQLDDLVGYQVHESLSSFRLNRVVYGLVDWATPDALRVQADVASVLRAQGAARATASAKLTADLRILDNQRTYLDGIMMAAIRSTGATGRPPPLAG